MNGGRWGESGMLQSRNWMVAGKLTGKVGGDRARVVRRGEGEKNQSRGSIEEKKPRAAHCSHVGEAPAFQPAFPTEGFAASSVRLSTGRNIPLAYKHLWTGDRGA